MSEHPPLYSIDQWLSKTQYQRYVKLLLLTWEERMEMTQQEKIKITWRQAECFVRLWTYLFLKDCQTHNSLPKPPLKKLAFPQGLVECNCSEAADVFYFDKKEGSVRSAGMMLDKLVNLRLIKKQSDHSCTQIQIQSLPEFLKYLTLDSRVSVRPDAFDPRNDAVPIANLLSRNYKEFNHNADVIPHRIINILRNWAEQYPTGMRVLRRDDNQNPVGFYVLYPTKQESVIKFSIPPDQGLYLSKVLEVDPFEIALHGDQMCQTVFVRSWIIDSPYQKQSQVSFLKDAQQTLNKMKKDFPKLCDMYTLIIHPSYTKLAEVLGFQTTIPGSEPPLYWMYQAVDRFLQLDMEKVVEELEKL